MDDKRKILYINLLDNALKQYRQGNTLSGVKRLMENSGLGEKQLTIVAEASLKAFRSETTRKALSSLLLGASLAVLAILAAFVFNDVYGLNIPAAIVCAILALLLCYRGIWLYGKIKKAAA